MIASDIFLDTLERWLDAKILWADESISANMTKWARTVDKGSRREFLNEVHWLNGYITAFSDLREKIERTR